MHHIHHFHLSCLLFKEETMAMKRTGGGLSAPHINTLTHGKNIVVIHRGHRK